MVPGCLTVVLRTIEAGPGNRAPAIEAINVDRMVFFMFPLTYVRGAELFDGDPERIILNRFSNSRIGKSNDDCTCLRDGICKRNVDIFSLIHWLLLNATCTTKKRTERIAINATRTRENVHIPIILFIYFPLIMSL